MPGSESALETRALSAEKLLPARLRSEAKSLENFRIDRYRPDATWG